LRARPEPTQWEHLSDASFLGRLLVFPANVRLDWKVIASTNTLAYLASSTVMKGKCFITLTPGANVIKLFTAAIYCHSMVIPSCVIKLYYLGNYHGMAVNYHGIKLFYNIGQKSVL
jgi:hypothetical protein